MVNGQGNYRQGVVDYLGENSVIADAKSPYPRMVGGEAPPTLAGIVSGFKVLEVCHHPLLDGTVELLEILVKLLRGLDLPPSRHRFSSDLSSESGRVRRPVASNSSIAASAAKASSRSAKCSRRAVRT
jgi:hypothetical protein